jgi:hypothetical protein
MSFSWATEDPNPTEKVAEAKRIEEEGQQAISGMLDEGLVEATQTLRALEDGDVEDFYPIEASRDLDIEEVSDEPPTKRIKNGGEGMAKGAGVLSAEAMENVRFYADLARKTAEEERKRKVPAKAGIGGLLGGYGSDEESD